MRVQSLDGKDPLEEEMATHSGILAWRIPWTEEPNGLSSIVSQRARHNWSDLAHRHTWRCNPTLVHISRENYNSKKTRPSICIAPLFTIAETRKQPKWLSTDVWIKKGSVCVRACICTTEYYSIIKKEWNNAIYSNMDEPRNYHTKQSKSKKKDKYHTISFTCEILKKKKDTNQLQNRNRPHRHRKQTYGYQKGKGGGLIS